MAWFFFKLIRGCTTASRPAARWRSWVRRRLPAVPSPAPPPHPPHPPPLKTSLDTHPPPGFVPTPLPADFQYPPFPSCGFFSAEQAKKKTFHRK